MSELMNLTVGWFRAEVEEQGWQSLECNWRGRGHGRQFKVLTQDYMFVFEARVYESAVEVIKVPGRRICDCTGRCEQQPPRCSEKFAHDTDLKAWTHCRDDFHAFRQNLANLMQLIEDCGYNDGRLGEVAAL